MARKRKEEYQAPVQAAPHQLQAALLADPDRHPAAFMMAFAPPGTEYPMSHVAPHGEQNAYRPWMIMILGLLTDMYPHPVNMALDCLRKSLIEVERGITPNLFKPSKRAKRKGNFAAHEAANLALCAANYIHDEIKDDQAYEQALADAGTTRIEINGWRNGRIDPLYRNHAIVGWADLAGAKLVLENAIRDYRKAMGKGSGKRAI